MVGSGGQRRDLARTDPSYAGGRAPSVGPCLPGGGRRFGSCLAGGPCPPPGPSMAPLVCVPLPPPRGRRWAGCSGPVARCSAPRPLGLGPSVTLAPPLGRGRAPCRRRRRGGGPGNLGTPRAPTCSAPALLRPNSDHRGARGPARVGRGPHLGSRSPYQGKLGVGGKALSPGPPRWGSPPRSRTRNFSCPLYGVAPAPPGAPAPLGPRYPGPRPPQRGPLCPVLPRRL